MDIRYLVPDVGLRRAVRESWGNMHSNSRENAVPAFFIEGPSPDTKWLGAIQHPETGIAVFVLLNVKVLRK
jgi:hypothetical protein